ncbi:MAG: hypothetical protein KYX62_05140 [Pseudomonadota bacterium]|nr:hypothetical protein [Pseudomonadota bacterium]
MKSLKLNVLILIVGLLLGAWVGSNWVRDRPLFANPFASDTVLDRLKDTGSGLLDSGKNAIDKLKN